MSEPRPHLELVPGGGEKRAPDAPARPAGGLARAGRGTPRWLAVLGAALGIALALAAWQIAAQGDRIEALAGELSAARAELARTRAAYQEHLARVRESLGPLESGLARLRELVARDPLAPSAAPARPAGSHDPAAPTP
jgi:hypothetical protein